MPYSESGESFDNRESGYEYPEFIYYNFPATFATIAITFPHSKVNIFEVPQAEPNIKELSIKVKNNEACRQKKKADVYKSSISVLPSFLREIINGFDNDKLEKISVEIFIQFIEKMLGDEARNVKDVIDIIKRQIEEELKLDITSPQGQIEIEGVYFEGKYYPFDKIQEELRPIVEERMKPFEQISPIKSGQYLYRAVDEKEWRDIVKDKIYFVPIRTNFEDNIGPQVQDYSRSEGYAGKIIRIKVQGPWFKKGGMAVPRVESLSPFYAEVEVLENEEWLPLT